MTDKLVDFVNALDQDPALQAQYKEDPRGTAESFGVSDEDLSLLFGGNTEALQQRLDMAGLSSIVWVQHAK
ncbi:hypothetical protein [Alteromonas oceanisediminis]|uniref:hypothetical protein n=1 Tax=Alteromonas oceanisediminis TaxID=2836180 RepID=UPI001BD9C9A8|nr:hypothetical protein [Alteromonas oceanisediminis]MBT0586629.1 hypothetical protein [Alteromonas oceanisediminis]